MPIRINEILTENEKQERKLLSDVFTLLSGDKAEPSAVTADKKNDVLMIETDIEDIDTHELVLRVIFTLHDQRKALEVLDVDVTIPNEEPATLDFLKLNESSLGWESWAVEHNDRRADIETVNRLLYPGKLKGKHSVSLSAMTYGEIYFGDTADEINKVLGSTSEVYPWQEAAGLGGEPVTISYSEDFVGMGWMMGKILKVSPIRFSLGDTIYEAIIAELNTGLGKLPAFFAKKYEGELREGRYVFTSVELKADLSCGENSYYTKRSV